MTLLIRCGRCRGRKEVMIFGTKYVKCPDCKGLGYIQQLTEEEEMEFLNKYDEENKPDDLKEEEENNVVELSEVKNKKRKLKVVEDGK